MVDLRRSRPLLAAGLCCLLAGCVPTLGDAAARDVDGTFPVDELRVRRDLADDRRECLAMERQPLGESPRRERIVDGHERGARRRPRARFR